ncbi:heparinase II/III family protein [Paenibacillus solanacearum]|uniref:heparinase II/III family protein n=1 Tax=Paenibacillus solanacearum TaxID=2048548 RepID=UPI001C402EB2|nr:heparinase II/III family protein [Paenibacillus solanacearum]
MRIAVIAGAVFLCAVLLIAAAAMKSDRARPGEAAPDRSASSGSAQGQAPEPMLLDDGAANVHPGSWRKTVAQGSMNIAQDPQTVHRAGAAIRMEAPAAAEGAIGKRYPVNGGMPYVVDVWMKADGLKTGKSAVKTVVTPLREGQELTKSSAPIRFESPVYERDTEFTRQRAYFIAPKEADSVNVQFQLAGPGNVWFTEASVERRPAWQEIIGKYDSSRVKHPVAGDLAKMIASWQWTPIAKESEADIRKAVAPLMRMEEQELIAAAQAEAANRKYVDEHAEFEAMARRLSILYSKTKDEAYARRAILIMTQFAASHGDVPKLIKDNDLFHSHGKYIPVDVLYGYDLIYNSGEWKQVDAKLGVSSRELVEGWIRSAVLDLYNLCNDEYYSNIVPYGLRNAFGAAVVLGDPDIIRMFLPWADTMFSGRQFHADGMWQEGTPSYNNQVAANALLAFQLLKESYQDPEGYTDSRYGRLDRTDLSLRYPILAKSKEIASIMAFPNGAPVALHDTWPKDPAQVAPGNPILRNKLKNIELWHFGHFALTQGDERNATQVHLTFPPLSEGLPYTAGHYHGNHLGLILWGAGMEMLPDAGYPKGPNRYFSMDTVYHNTPWVWSADAEPYKQSQSLFTRPSLLAYDPGDASQKQVQLVEASEPGPARDGAEVKRRLLMLVQLEGNRAYAVDVSRLKGGQAHELFMHSSEDEDTEMNASLPLTGHDGTVQDYMKAIGKEQGLSGYRDKMSSPQTGDGSRDFRFTWTGASSGSSVRAYMNGVPGGEVIFSQIPSIRRTGNDPAQAGDYPAWHLYRRHLVGPGEATRYGAIYETWRKQEQPLLRSVAWPTPDPADDMTVAAVVQTDRFTDTIYISDDTQERTVSGMRLAGKAAVVRQEASTGSVLWGYVYGQGTIRAGDFTVQGAPDYNLKVVRAEGSLNRAAANTLVVDGKLPDDGSLSGAWLRTEFPDRSGYGMRIEKIQDGSTIVLQQPPGFEVTPSGVRMLYFPSAVDPANGNHKLHRSDSRFYVDRVYSGDVRMELRRPVFLKAGK